MCGLLGWFSKGDSHKPQSFSQALELIRHRGPDATRIEQGDHFAFGHHRLSVLDLDSRAHQPMWSQDQRYVIIYNGEIYNYREVRKQLSPPMGGWRTNSDTEVILELVIQKGTQGLELLEGMFSFGLLDTQKQEILLARDSLGTKPLYYFQTKEELFFASRPGPLLKLQNHHEFDSQGIRYFLDLGFFPKEMTAWKNIKKLPAGHFLTLKSDGALTVSKYSTLFETVPNYSLSMKSFAKIKDETEEALIRSVQQRLISDVPVGVFLSSGIDSGLIAAIATKFNPNITAFTIGFEDEEFNELPLATKLAQFLQLQQISEIVTPKKLLEELQLFETTQDEPFFDYSLLLVRIISKIAKQHVTVALGGDGGDELFGGYKYYRWLSYFESVEKIPLALRQCISKAVPPKSHRLQLMSQLLKQNTAPEAFYFMRSLNKDLELPLNSEILTHTESGKDLFLRYAKDNKGLQPLDIAMRWDLEYTLPDDYLQKLDMGSMAYSLEAREPFLGKDLVRLALQMPHSFKIHKGLTKYILREIAKKYLPQEIQNKHKSGFEVPMKHWIKTELKEQVSRSLKKSSHFIDSNKARKLLQCHLDGKRNTHSLLWATYNISNLS